MIVYRLENEAGEGAYRAYDGRAVDRVEDAGLHEPSFRRERPFGSELPDPHPGPAADGLGYPSDAEHFGFASLRQMRQWFFREPHDAEALAVAGLLVTEWETDRRFVRFGNRQVTFIRELAEMVNRYSPRDLAQTGPPLRVGAWAGDAPVVTWGRPAEFQAAVYVQQFAARGTMKS